MRSAAADAADRTLEQLTELWAAHLSLVEASVSTERRSVVQLLRAYHALAAMVSRPNSTSCRSRGQVAYIAASTDWLDLEARKALEAEDDRLVTRAQQVRPAASPGRPASRGLKRRCSRGSSQSKAPALLL